MNHPGIKACIVGTGFIGPAHLEALRRLGVGVSGLVEMSEEFARRKAGELGIDRAYASLEEALADPEASVFHLAVPNHLHFPLAKKVLQAGKHVVCEKPLAMTSAESAELLALARGSGRVCAVNYNLRFYPLVREARERIAKGEVGKIHLVHGSYLQDWLLYDTDWNWRLESGKGGALRAVSDIGTHWLDMVGFVTGLEAESVFADTVTVHAARKRPTRAGETFGGSASAGFEDVPISTDDFATILIRYRGGARGSLTVSQVSAGRKNSLSFEIDGAAESLSWNSESPNGLLIGRRDGPNLVLPKDPALLSGYACEASWYPGGHQEGYPDTLRSAFANIYRYIENGDFSIKPEFPTFEDGHREMLLCDAIAESAVRGRWTPVADR
jgi:predicted dehydrogenase